MVDTGQVRIRLARDSDVEAIRAVEASTPLVIGDVSITSDRGDDWFAPTRLMEEAITLVVEVGSRIAGVCCGARHRARIAGVERWMLYVHQARILPEHQAKGLGIQLVADLFSRFRDRGNDSSYWFIARDNSSSQAFAGSSFNKWSFGPYRATLPADTLAGADAGRPATPEDAADVVEILNEAHDREEFFLPYTVETLTARLERAPAIYSWADLRLGDGAVVGVWSLESTVRRSRAGATDEERESAVLDYGAVAGADAELDALLRCACAEASSQGVGSLAILCCEGARAHPLVDELAEERLDLDVWTPSLPEPPGAREVGVYVDAVYF